MLTSYLVIAESGQTWTPETFYVAAAVLQLVGLLIFFRVTQLPTEYATFINGLFVVVPVNAVAYFTKDIGLVGVLATGTLLFVMLAAVTRGDVFNAIGGWFLVVGAYWVAAYFILPAEPDLYIEDLGNIPQVVMEGGFEQETLREEEITGEDDEDDPRTP